MPELTFHFGCGTTYTNNKTNLYSKSDINQVILNGTRVISYEDFSTKDEFIVLGDVLFLYMRQTWIYNGKDLVLVYTDLSTPLYFITKP